METKQYYFKVLSGKLKFRYYVINNIRARLVYPYKELTFSLFETILEHLPMSSNKIKLLILLLCNVII